MRLAERYSTFHTPVKKKHVHEKNSVMYFQVYVLSTVYSIHSSCAISLSFSLPSFFHLLTWRQVRERPSAPLGKAPLN